MLNMSLLKNLAVYNKFGNIIRNNSLIFTSINVKAQSFLAQGEKNIPILNRKCNPNITEYCTAPKNPLVEFHSANEQHEKGAVYDKKPFKLVCEAGKNYSWCACGKSKSQPLCDGTHKNVFLKIKLRPIRFNVTETKEYYLCNCKQTNNRPFCDGTHKSELVQGSNVRTN